MRGALAISLAAACDLAPAPVARAPSASCREVAEHELGLRGLESKERDVKLAAVCHDDRWSIDVRRCIVAASAADALDRCDALLAPEQRDHYRGELDEISAAAR